MTCNLPCWYAKVPCCLNARRGRVPAKVRPLQNQVTDGIYREYTRFDIVCHPENFERGDKRQ